MLSPLFPGVLLLVLTITSGLAELPLGYNYLGRSRKQGAEYNSFRNIYDANGHGSYSDFTGAGYRDADFGRFKGDAYSSESKFGGNHAISHYLNNNLQALYRDMLSGNQNDYHHEYNSNLGAFTNGYENYPTEENYHGIRGYTSSGSLKGLNSGTRGVGYKFSTLGGGSYLSGASSNIGNSEIGSGYNGGENYGISSNHEGSLYSAGDDYYRSRGNYRGYGSNIKGYNGDHAGARYRRGRYAGHLRGYNSGGAKGYRIKDYQRGLGYSSEFKGYNGHPKGSSIKPYGLRGGHRGNSYFTNSHNRFNFGNDDHMHGPVNIGQSYSTNYGGIKGGYSHLSGDFGEDVDGYSHSSKGYEDIHGENPYSSYGEHHYIPRGYVKAIKGEYTSGISGDYKFEDTSGAYP